MCTRISSVKLCHHEATSHQIPKRTSLPRFGCARWHHVRGSCQPTNDNFACSPVQQKCLFLCAGPLEHCLTTNVAPCMIVQPGVVIKTLMLHIKLASCRSLSSSIRVFSCAHILCHIQVGQHSSRDAESKTVFAAAKHISPRQPSTHFDVMPNEWAAAVTTIFM